MVRRPLSKLSKILLPAILIQKDDTAVVLASLSKSGKEAQVILPETGHGTDHVPFEDLEENYSGYAILVKPEYRFGEKAAAAEPPEGSDR